MTSDWNKVNDKLHDYFILKRFSPVGGKIFFPVSKQCSKSKFKVLM